MINEIAPLTYINHFEEKEAKEENYIMFVEKGKTLMKREGENIDYPKFKDLLKDIKYVYIFSFDSTDFFLAMDYDEEVLEDLFSKGYEFKSTGAFYKAKPKHLCFAGITACQLKNWYNSNKYCGRCRAELKHSHKERMLYCPECKNIIYPRISPVVIVGVISGDKILRIKYRGRGAMPNYGLIAGFAEIGETIEETVKREVMEEAGLKVKDITYYKSQPWSFSESLLFGFYCHVDGDDTVHMDENELSYCEWARRDEILDVSTEISLTNDMIMNFKHKGIE